MLKTWFNQSMVLYFKEFLLEIQKSKIKWFKLNNSNNFIVYEEIDVQYNWRALLKHAIQLFQYFVFLGVVQLEL